MTSDLKPISYYLVRIFFDAYRERKSPTSGEIGQSSRKGETTAGGPGDQSLVTPFADGAVTLIAVSPAKKY